MRLRPPRYVRKDGTPSARYPGSGSGCLWIVVLFVVLMLIGLLFGKHGIFASAGVPLATWRVKGIVDTGPASFPNFRQRSVNVEATDLIRAAVLGLPKLRRFDPMDRGVTLIQVTRVSPRAP